MASMPPHWSIFTATTGNHRQTRQQSNNRQWLPPRVSSSPLGSHSLSAAPPSSPSPVSHRKLPTFSPLLTPNSSPPLSSDFSGRRSTRFVSKMHFNRPKTTTSTRHTPADVSQSTNQYMEPAQHGVHDVLNISTEVHVFHHGSVQCIGPSRMRPEMSFGWNYGRMTDLTVLELAFPVQLHILRHMVELESTWDELDEMTLTWAS
uniref:Uncharacterized protein n=1 Tax=Brassica oleracea var. oleracea TaxID=109376 RepID=A0A0D3BT48_BRAOL